MILKSRLREIMVEAGTTKYEFADMIGISRITLDKVLNNDWQQIQRSTIVKLCEALSKEIGEIFYLEAESIWSRLRETRRVDLIIGGRVSSESDLFSAIPDEGIRREALGFWDMLAWSELLSELRSIVPERLVFGIHAFPVDISKEQPLSAEDRELAKTLLTSGNTCLIIGGAKTNSVFDYAYREIAEVQGSNRSTPPYEFGWIAPPGVKYKSSFSLRAVDKYAEQGIYSAAANMTLPITPRSLVRARPGVDFIDAGIVILSLDCGNNTTVLGFGGLGGPGTLGCVTAFLRQKEHLDRLVRSSPYKSAIKIVVTKFRKESYESSHDDRYVTDADIITSDADFLSAAREAHEQMQRLMKEYL